MVLIVIHIVSANVSVFTTPHHLKTFRSGRDAIRWCRCVPAIASSSLLPGPRGLVPRYVNTLLYEGSAFFGIPTLSFTSLLFLPSSIRDLLFVFLLLLRTQYFCTTYQQLDSQYIKLMSENTSLLPQ